MVLIAHGLGEGGVPFLPWHPTHYRVILQGLYCALITSCTIATHPYHDLSFDSSVGLLSVSSSDSCTHIVHPWHSSSVVFRSAAVHEVELCPLERKDVNYALSRADLDFSGGMRRSTGLVQCQQSPHG